MGDPQYMVNLARQRGRNLGVFMTRLLDGTFPWAKLRQAQKLMRLVDRYGAATVEAACRRALGFEAHQRAPGRADRPARPRQGGLHR